MTELSTMTGQQINAQVLAKLDEYKNMNVLEQYAIFMGKAQMLEYGLKGMITRKFKILDEDMDGWTLGRTKNELRDRGVRADFIAFLESVVTHRNNMAHEFLVNIGIIRSITNFSVRKHYSDLFRALYEIEQIIILHDWCEENDGWLP